MAQRARMVVPALEARIRALAAAKPRIILGSASASRRQVRGP